MPRSKSTFSCMLSAASSSLAAVVVSGQSDDGYNFNITSTLLDIPAGSFLQSPQAGLQYMQANDGAVASADTNSGDLWYRDSSGVMNEQNSKYAFVTIFYEVGMNDAEYFLGARVALNSAKYFGSVADRVVIVTPECKQKYIDTFHRDGVRVRVLHDNIAGNYEHLQRWGNVLNKLTVWDMTEYERVIFMDADVIVTANPDVLFNCGHFCPVYFNMVRFHTGLMVIKPDHAELLKLIEGLDHMSSYDGADQGFLNAFYGDVAASAPRFHPEHGGVSEDPVNRLSQLHCMHNMYFYPMMSWIGYTKHPDKDILTMTYPTFVVQQLKPWCWYTFPLWDQNFLWSKQRWALVSFWGEWWMYFVALLIAPIGGLAAHKGVTMAQARFFPAKPGVVTLSRSWVLHILLSGIYVGCLVLPLQFLPALVPHELAWPCFLTYFVVFCWISTQLVCLSFRWPVLPFDTIYFIKFFLPIVLIFFYLILPAWAWVNGAVKSLVGIAFVYLLSRQWWQITLLITSRMLSLSDPLMAKADTSDVHQLLLHKGVSDVELGDEFGKPSTSRIEIEASEESNISDYVEQEAGPDSRARRGNKKLIV